MNFKFLDRPVNTYKDCFQFPKVEGGAEVNGAQSFVCSNISQVHHHILILYRSSVKFPV